MTDLSSFLSDAGYSESILEKGLAGLVQDWEKTVKELEKGWTLDWEDFANEVDGRRIIDEIVKAFPAATPTNLLQLDLRFRAATTMDACIWGAEVAQDEGWNSMQHWYYFRVPKSGFPSKA
jgi:hypothetical protein